MLLLFVPTHIVIQLITITAKHIMDRWWEFPVRAASQFHADCCVKPSTRGFAQQVEVHTEEKQAFFCAFASHPQNSFVLVRPVQRKLHKSPREQRVTWLLSNCLLRLVAIGTVQHMGQSCRWLREETQSSWCGPGCPAGGWWLMGQLSKAFLENNMICLNGQITTLSCSSILYTGVN